MKKLLFTAAAFLLSVSLLTGCQREDIPGGESSVSLPEEERISSLDAGISSAIGSDSSMEEDVSSSALASSETTASREREENKASSQNAPVSSKAPEQNEVVNPPAEQTSSKAPTPSSQPQTPTGGQGSAGQASSAPAASNIQEFQREVFRLVNQEREKQGLPALTLNETLCSAAQKRAEEIKVKFDHTRPDGTSCFTVLEEFGMGAFSACGENIAMGQTSPAQVMESWMNSPGHRANILSPDFAAIGVGFIDNHWVQLFWTGF